MKLFFHYCSQGFSNCYIVGTDYYKEDASLLQAAQVQKKTPPPREAIIIDPGNMNTEILDIIEKNSYRLRGVFITHDHPHHVQGLKTITRIYGTKIYAINPLIKELRTNPLRDGDIIKLGTFRVEVISVPGHSADSAVFKIGRLLFTGDALTAGLVGSTASSYAAANQITALRSKIMSLPGDFTILPGHGPPTSLEAERRFNFGLDSFEQQKVHRPSFKFEL
ncbi:MAG: MBL fold metallo-hydrolase [Treponema sp.]|nr:MBL fold metallo-hydrolase [Treponema sp.]